jgi:hypothetical protein
MDKGSIGMMMEVYTLGDTRMATGLKGSSISCNRMALTHSSMSRGDGLRRRKLAKVIRLCDSLAIYKEYFLVYHLHLLYITLFFLS